MDDIVQELVRSTAAMGEKINNIQRRLDEQVKLTETVHKLAMSLEVLVNKQQATDKKLDDVKKDIEDIKLKPAKKADSYVTTIVTSVITGIVAFLLAKFGFK